MYEYHIQMEISAWRVRQTALWPPNQIFGLAMAHLVYVIAFPRCSIQST